MKTQHHSRLIILVGVISLATLVLSLGPGSAWALPPGPCQVVEQPTLVPMLDTDCDGFHDALEQAGVPLSFDGQATSIPFCNGAAHSGCMDPNDPDLFIVLVRATPTKIPAGALACISDSIASGGLGIATHILAIDQVSADRQVTAATRQRALIIAEAINGTGTVFGTSGHEGPNGLGLQATVYPVRMENFILGVYGGPPPSGLLDAYVTEVVCHECGHVLGLTSDYDKRFNGFHNKSGTDNIMEQNVNYTTKGSNIDFFISTAFTSIDPESACLNAFDFGGNCLTNVE